MLIIVWIIKIIKIKVKLFYYFKYDFKGLIPILNLASISNKNYWLSLFNK